MTDILQQIYSNYIVAILPCITAVISVIMVLIKIINTAKETKTVTSEAFKQLKEALSSNTISSEQYNSSMKGLIEEMKRKHEAETSELVTAVIELKGEVDKLQAKNDEILANYESALMQEAI